MRIYMQITPKDQPLRFCHLLLQQDLLGSWVFIKEVGYQGAAGRIKRELCKDQLHGQKVLTQQRDLMLRKGFRVVFSEN